MSIGLLHPAAALGFLAIGALVLLHLRARRRRPVPVASLLLWRQLPAAPLERRRFRADRLFALRLGLLLALVLGALGPYVERPGGQARGTRLLLVLDVSASMQAAEVEGSRFELVRRRAAALVAALGTGDEAMVVAAAERARVVVRWTTDHALVHARLEALEPLDVPGTLAPALSLALGEVAARPDTRAAVLTDLPPAASGLDPPALAALDWVQVGATDDNVAVAGLTVEQPPFGAAAAATATALVRSYAAAARRVRVEARVDGAAWAVEELALGPRGTAVVRLAAPPAAGVVEVAIRGRDALAADDRALAWIVPEVPVTVSVTATTPEASGALQRLLGAVPGIRIADGPGAIGVFDGVAPVPSRPGLYLAPPPGNGICPVAEDEPVAAAVVDWDAGHPVAAGMTGLESLELAAARPLARSTWGDAVVTAAADRVAFPLLIAGERAGGRVACLAESPVAAGAASDRLPLLLLALSALRWLGAPSGDPLVVPTGAPVMLGDGAVDPVPGVRLAADAGWAVAERAGVHRLGGRLLLASLLDDRESDIGRSGGGQWTAHRRMAAAGGAARHELARWLYLVAAALLAVEWLAWRRRVGT